MKKPKIEAEEQQPRRVIRADKAPTEGYSLVVDGHFKSHHDTVETAEEAGMALKNQYQMLQVQVYDAATKTRSMIEWPAASFANRMARRFSVRFRIAMSAAAISAIALMPSASWASLRFSLISLSSAALFGSSSFIGCLKIRRA